MKLFLKRDESSTKHPAPEQLEVGELVINSVTGKLYSKLKNGTVVEWTSQKVCFDPVPEFNFLYQNTIVVDTINDFCCPGDLLVIDIKKLKPEPASYTFELIELTTNTLQQNIIISPPQYTNYTIVENNQTVPVRKAIIPINLSITETNNISIFKFTISLNGEKLTEKLLTIKCRGAECEVA